MHEPQGSDCPEARLWWAVLLRFQQDIELASLAVLRDIERTGEASRQTDSFLRTLLKHAAHPWTGEVCSFVGMSHREFLEGIKRGLPEGYK